MDRHSYRNTILLEAVSLSTFQVSELVLLLTKYELQTGVKISNTSLVCRKDGVEIHESVSYQGWFVYNFHPWHENGRWINRLIVQDGVVSLALGFFPSLCWQQSLSSSWSAVCCFLFWDPRSGLMERAPYDSLIEPWQGWQLHRAGGSMFSHLSWAMPDSSGASGWVSTAGSPRISVLNSPSSGECALVTHILQSMLSVEVLA